jgi:monoamine oxidase
MVIVTIPPALASRLQYSPAMPAMRDQLTQQVPMGSVIKYHVGYQRPFWLDEGLSGSVSSPRPGVGGSSTTPPTAVTAAC